MTFLCTCHRIEGILVDLCPKRSPSSHCSQCLRFQSTGIFFGVVENFQSSGSSLKFKMFMVNWMRQQGLTVLRISNSKELLVCQV